MTCSATRTGCNAWLHEVPPVGISANDPLRLQTLANGLTDDYEVSVVPSGNEACAYLTSTCSSVTPSTTTTP